MAREHYFIKNPNGGFGPSANFKPAPGSVLKGGQFYDKYVDESGQVYQTIYGSNNNPIEGNSPASRLVPVGQTSSPNVYTSGQYRDIGNIGTGQSVEDVLGPPFNPAIGPQYNAGGGNKPLQGPSVGQNAPGQGFYTPEALSNAARAVQERLNAISTSVNVPVPLRGTTPATVPSAPAQPFQDFTAELKNYLTGTSPISAPAAPIAPATPTLDLTSLQGQAGITGTQTDVLNAKNDLRNFENTILSEQDRIKGAVVSTTVIGRNLAKLSADTAETLRTKQNALSEATDRLQMANNTLSTLIDLNKWNYAQAKDAYDSNFTKNFQLFSLTNTILNQNQTHADASIKTILDLAADKPYDQTRITPEMQTQWQALDLQGQHQPGFTEAMYKLTAGSKFKVDTWRTTENGVTSVYATDKNGQSRLIQTVGQGTGNEESIKNKFAASLVDRAKLDIARTREQFIRQLQAQYPQIEPNDIARKVYETYPDRYNEVGNQGVDYYVKAIHNGTMDITQVPAGIRNEVADQL